MSVPVPVEEPAPVPVPTIEDDPRLTVFQLTVQAAARGLADRGDHRLIDAFHRPDADPLAGRRLKIGLFGNLANQAYITARALRRLGHDVDLILQENNNDSHVLSRPFWEEVEMERPDPDAAVLEPEGWSPPDWVKIVRYDLDMQYRFEYRFSAVPEVTAMYLELTGKTLAPDEALVLAQWMGHWDLIRAMHNYDVVHLSMWPICLGMFCAKPYVVTPLGGDLYICGFQEDVQGLMFRASFRRADFISVCETDYGKYLDRLGTTAPRAFLPLVVDTEIYCPGVEEELRAAWRAKVGGTRYLLGVCRQSWDWKGSDLLIRAFGRFHAGAGGEWRLLLQSWGDDLDRSRALVTELGLDAVTHWLPMCSKPLLRRRQRAADAVADQFVMEGYGASVLESMAAGQPVVMAPVPPESARMFRFGPPPFVGARNVDEIEAALTSLNDDTFRAQTGARSRAWVEREHGFPRQTERHLAMLKLAAARSPGPFEADVETGAEPMALTDSIVAAHRGRQADIMNRWTRAVPFGDAFTDRWERARFLGFGEGANIYDSALVLGPVTVGEKTWIGPNTVLDGSGGLSIGKTCTICAGAQIYSHDTVAWAVSGGRSPYRRAPTEIGDHVFLGPGSVVAMGCKVGAHSMIGALSFVNSDIPPYSLAVGTPAKVVGRISIADDGRVTIAKLAGA